MKKNILLITILLISAFFGFGVKGKSLTCTYEINYPFVDGAMTSSSYQMATNTYYNYTKHLFAFKYQGTEWVDKFSEYLKTNDLYYKRGGSIITSATLELGKPKRNGQGIFDYLVLYNEEDKEVGIFSTVSSSIDGFVKCPAMVKVVKPSGKRASSADFKTKFSLLTDYSIPNVDTFISNFYFEDVQDNGYPLLFMNDPMKIITGGIAYINYAYSVNLAPTSQNRDIVQVIEDYLKIDGFIDELDKINEEKDKALKNESYATTAMANEVTSIKELVQKIANIDTDEIGRKLDILKKFNDVTIGKYTGFRNILYKFYLDSAAVDNMGFLNMPFIHTEGHKKFYNDFIFGDRTTTNFYKMFLDKPTTEVDKQNYYTQYVDPLIDVLSYAANHSYEVEKFRISLDLEDVKNKFSSCENENDCVKICTDKDIEKLKYFQCEEQTGGYGTSYDECLRTFNAQENCEYSVKNDRNMGDIIDNFQDQAENKFEQSVKNYVIETYKQQGIAIDIKDIDWCKILFDEGKQDGLYKYIKGSLTAITII